MRLVLSGADLAGKIGRDRPELDPAGHKVPHRPVVAVDRVRFVGECVALVVAENQAQAHDAIGLIEVDYDDIACGYRRGSRDQRRRAATP